MYPYLYVSNTGIYITYKKKDCMNSLYNYSGVNFLFNSSGWMKGKYCYIVITLYSPIHANTIRLPFAQTTFVPACTTFRILSSLYAGGESQRLSFGIPNVSLLTS